MAALLAGFAVNPSALFAGEVRARGASPSGGSQAMLSPSDGGAPSSRNTSVSRPPYDGAEFWSKVVGLLRLHGGFIEPAEVEAAFDAKVVRKANYGDAGYGADVIGSSKWFGGFLYQRYTKAYSENGRVINDGGDLSVLILPGVYEVDDKNYCIKPVQAERQLISMGWVVAPEETGMRDLFNEDYFRLMNASTRSIITFSYGAGTDLLASVDPEKACVLGISIVGKAR